MNEGEPTLTYHIESAVIRKPRRVDWLPREDITAYELALALPTLLSFVVPGTMGWRYPEDDITALPVNVQRHFKIHD